MTLGELVEATGWPMWNRPHHGHRYATRRPDACKVSTWRAARFAWAFDVYPAF